MNENRQAYESLKVVRDYKKLNRMFPAEEVLNEMLLKKTLKQNMLDLGVGAGRTTNLFSSYFHHYTGIDFAKPMIEFCENRFKDKSHLNFIHADVTTLDKISLSVENFDFVLYSLNGISYLKTLEDRINLFSNSYNLLNTDGIFAFSAHNSKSIVRRYSYQLPKRNPFRLITELEHYIKIRKINGSVTNFLDKDFFQLYDGGEYFTAYTAYILPSFQIKLLENAGFKNIRTVDIKGNTLSNNNVDDCDDDWIHYFCNKG